ncbi:MAG: cytochrome c5 family protein [Lysobacterales bacterium]
MKKLTFALWTALAVVACKPQDPAPLPPEVGTRSAPAAQPPATTEAVAAAADAAANDAAPSPAVAASAISGEDVYKKACTTCHATGLAGAPKLGDAADWGPRLAQGEALLFEHAIKGFTGKKGMMPPKGGFMNLSDDEVRAAIDYMTTASAP